MKLTSNTEDTYEIASPLHSQILRVARAFGDFRFKWAVAPEKDKTETETETGTEGFRALVPAEQAVTCVPEIIARARSRR